MVKEYLCWDDFNKDIDFIFKVFFEMGMSNNF